jgi:diguanylate cyclase
MRYQENREQSAEVLRLTVPLMSRQQASFHPQTYTLWYEHCAGINPRLSRVLEAKLEANATLSNDETWQLYAQYIVARDADNVGLIQQRLCDLIDDTGHFSALAGEEATQFTQTLTFQRDQLAQPLAVENVRAILAELIVDTERMRTTTMELAERLENSVVEVRSLREQLEKAEHEATRDPLTGLLNRRGLSRAAQALFQPDQPVRDSAMLLIDIDRFKEINDKYGHLVGDKVISTVAQVVRENIKGRDLAARVGGDEFAVLLPDTQAKGASVLAQQIRKGISALEIRRSNQNAVLEKVTLSIGISESGATGQLDQMLEDADKAMYAVKSGGRDHVQVFSGQMSV